MSRKNLVQLVMCVVLLAGVFAIPATSFAQGNNMSTNSSVSASDSDQLLGRLSNVNVDQLAQVLKVIENTPEQLLENGTQAEINQYFKENLPGGKFQPRGVWGCSLAIAAALATAAFPAWKIARLAADVRELGGAWEAAKLIVGASTTKERLGAFRDLVGLLTGITAIQEKCGL